MEDDTRPLSDEERAELERLRAQKARRERSELEELRREQALRERGGEPSGGAPARRAGAVTPDEARRIERDREVRARNARLMEPDEDLGMPLGQKVVLVGIFAVAIVAILAMVLGPR